MAGFLPPAAGAAVRSSTDDTGAVIKLGSKRAPTALVPGVGQAIRAVGGELLFDASAAEPALSLHHFHPGALPAAGTVLRTFRNNRLVSSALGALLEVHLTTPAANVTGGNYGIRLSGSGGGQTDLQLNVAGQQLYRAELQAPSELGARLPSTGSSDMENARGMATYFEVSADTVVHGVEFRTDNNGAGSLAMAAGARRVGILDGLGQWVVYASTLTAFGPNADHRVLLPVATTLKAGQPYYFALLGESGVKSWTTRGGANSGLVNASSRTIAGVAHVGMAILDRATPGLSFSEVLATAPVQTGTWGGSTKPEASLITTNAGTFRLLGRTAGLGLTGDLSLSVITTGTPPSTPADVNMRLEIAAGR